jgi:hypothetical protein
MIKVIFRGLIFILLVVLITVVACNQAQIGRENIMALTGSIPPIDAAAPIQTDTATFALG